MREREIHGDDLLYRFFNYVIPKEPELFKHVPHLLVISMSVWFPKSVYQEMPVLLPWVVRDPTCRGKRSRGQIVEPDQWGSPNSDGYLRDDNSLVKGLPRSLSIYSSAYPFINGKRLGSEFVASHIWRNNRTGVLASRLPELNTFIPNLVWLPSQVAKLSDREDGSFQTALKEVSWSIFRSVPLDSQAQDIAEKSWALLTPPGKFRPLLDSEINWFVSNLRFIKTRKAKLAAVIRALEQVRKGEAAPRTLQPSRYRDGLPGVSVERLGRLQSDLILHDRGLAVELDRSESQQ